ncbi:uncharacterized protein LOC144198588 [Stigmatopora nigra]
MSKQFHKGPRRFWILLQPLRTRRFNQLLFLLKQAASDCNQRTTLAGDQGPKTVCEMVPNSGLKPQHRVEKVVQTSRYIGHLSYYGVERFFSPCPIWACLLLVEVWKLLM